MSKSGFDFSKIILSNAQRLGKEAVEIDINLLIYTKSSLDETLIKKYMAMDTCPPPILVIDTGTAIKIVDGHHRVEAQKRKGHDTVFVYIS